MSDDAADRPESGAGPKSGADSASSRRASGQDASYADAYRPARLAARDAEDLAVISALLQDAIVLAGEMAYLSTEKRFAFVGNRFRWEEPDAGERVRVGVHFEDVRRARFRGLDPDVKDLPLAVLSVAFEPDETPPGGTVRIACAGEAEIILEVEALEASLRDMTRPWRASATPRHRPPE